MVQQRRIVYFLGAGASRAAGAYATVQHGGRIPALTQENFWGTFLRFCRWSDNCEIIESFLFRYFLGYSRVPPRLTPRKKRASVDQIDVEEVFTFISERIAAPATAPQLRVAVDRVWQSLTEEIGHVFSKFPANAASRKLYREFMDRHVKSRDTIVSFNYDTVFEDSIRSAHRYYYGELKYQKAHGIRVLKPHGSVNWELRNREIRVRRSPEQSVIVAPTHLKFVSTSNADNEEANGGYGYLNQTIEMQNIWATMEEQMRGARVLVFLGYSFPVADLYFSSVLRSVLAVRATAPRIVVVNPDAWSISARIRKRFSLAKVDTYFDFSQFNQASRLK